MKVKNLIFSCITVAMAALILGVFAGVYPMLSNLEVLPEMIKHPDAWPYAILILAFLMIVVFTGLILIFSAVGIFCDCGLIKSEKASKAMKIVSLVLACFVLLFELGSLIVVGLVLQYLINVVLTIALLVITILNLVFVNKKAKQEVKSVPQQEVQPEPSSQSENE